jgi:t-SNARE complex subunit (syntaxin)
MKTKIDGSIQDDKFVHSYNKVEQADDFIRSQKKNTPWLVIILAVLVIIIIIVVVLVGAL